MARLLIADNQAAAVAGYRQFLKTDPSIILGGEAIGEEQILVRLAEGRWDLLLLDIQAGVTDGLAMLRRLRSSHPEVPMLVVTGLPEGIYARSALQAGAAGFLSKSVGAAELLQVIRRVLSGQRHFSEAVLTSVQRIAGAPEMLPHETLSRRELQVFQLIGAGNMLTRIAKDLTLSVKTISTYRTRILEKTGLQTNADIVAYVTRHKIMAEK